MTSPIIESDLRFLRQMDAVNMRQLSQLNITLIGCGAIGSTTAMWLGKMGVGNIILFDDDNVETHNWSNQMYREVDIGKPKVQALQEVMSEFGLQSPKIVSERYSDQTLSEVVISGVDSMRSRKIIWKSVHKTPSVKLYIDARMGLETLMVFAVNPQTRDSRISYSKSLYSDEAATPEPCTARTIAYTPLMASSIICNIVKRYANQEYIPEKIVLDLATYTLIV